MSFIKVVFALIIFSIIYGCGAITSTTDTQSDIAKQIFSDSVTKFSVKVFYEPTAVPYTGVLNLTHDTWDITKQSYQALFQTHTGRTIETPVTTGDMTAIAAQNKSTWSEDELISLGSATALPLMNGTESTVSVIFLNGKFNGIASVLGVHFTGYPFVFIFKDVVVSTGGTGNDQKYVEQAVVVHEVGHAVGLVNNGVPMTTPHEDSVHPKHNSNNQCVMYWQVEYASSVLSSLSGLIAGGSLNLFASDSISDGTSYHP